MGEVTREELSAMTDQELLAYEREHHGDPYVTLVKAKGMQRVALQLWHVGAARTKAAREARAEARRGLNQKLGGPDWRKSFVIDERDQLTEYNDE